MLHRLMLAGALALLALTLPRPAQAGGWAVTTLDPLPAEGFRAGETYRIGYTVRQHGQTPLGGLDTVIQVSSASSGESHAFPGVAEGTTGHYVADVRFPAAGEWAWEVHQGPFPMQALGAVTVTAPIASGPGPVEAGIPPLVDATGGTALATGLLVVSLLSVGTGVLTRARRRSPAGVAGRVE